jgi:hypothetical protein
LLPILTVNTVVVVLVVVEVVAAAVVVAVVVVVEVLVDVIIIITVAVQVLVVALMVSIIIQSAWRSESVVNVLNFIDQLNCSANIERCGDNYRDMRGEYVKQLEFQSISSRYVRAAATRAAATEALVEAGSTPVNETAGAAAEETALVRRLSRKQANNLEKE